jgi:tetratricopeptide (TPR) repeat protein
MDVRERVSPAEVLGSLAIAFLARPMPQREDAEEHLREALRLDPQDPGACAGMGWLELQRGHRDPAHEWFARALERDPLSAPAVRLMASQLLLDASQRSSATERQAVSAFVRRALDRARAVAPDDPELEGLLARSYVVSPGDDPTPGWAHIVRANEALPGRTDFLLDRLALAAVLGRDDEARQVFDAHFRDAARPELAHAARNALLVGDVRAANRLLAKGDATGAERRLAAARERLADDPELVREADHYLSLLKTQQSHQREAAVETAAIAEYNAGIEALNSRRYAAAAAAFRRAAAASARADFRRHALQMAVRMDLHVRGDRAVALANAGKIAEALAIFEAMDRASMSEEDRRWLDGNIAQLRRMRPR